MTGLTTVPPEVEQYLAAVRESLADLPPLERDDLLAEVEASLAEAAADTDSLTATLGRPEEFAAELRSAAGLHEPAVYAPQPPEIVRRLRAVLAGLADRPGVASVRRAAVELAPIWWVVRGYVVVAAIAHLLQTDWSPRYAFVPRFGSAEFGLVVIVLGVAASVGLGLRLRRRPTAFRRLAALANIAVAVAAVPVADAFAGQLTRAQDILAATAGALQPLPAPSPGLVYDGRPVDNIYPFSREGRLLHDVLLYDGRGRPLEIPTNRALDPDRRVVVTNGNRPLFNAFPIRYYEPGTRRVERPNAAPYVELPLVLTPPLPDRRK
jgi:hypothetical protein